jgi:UDP-glucose 4-epimerase
VLDLLVSIQHVAGTNVEPEFAEARAGELQRSMLDISSAQRELGWRPRHTLEQGLAETWGWITA